MEDSFDAAESEIVSNRLEAYGTDAREANRHCAIVWQAMIDKWSVTSEDEPLNSRMVLLMKAADKILRACIYDRNCMDDFVDARQYIKLAYEAGKRGHNE